MREWQVLLNGEVWTDRFNSEELAKDYVEEEVAKGIGEIGDFEVSEMEVEDINKY